MQHHDIYVHIIIIIGCVFEALACETVLYNAALKIQAAFQCKMRYADS